jgi:O-antigen/teichoic acid export membrane protein
MKIFHNINQYISSKDSRNKNAIKNILFSFLIKGLSIFISLVQLPIALKYIGNEQYGIWLTLSSVFMWFSMFDLGLGNGLRNKFAEAIALNDLHKAKVYVSTTYAILSLIVVLFAVIFFIISDYISWEYIFNCKPQLISNLRLVVLCFLIPFLMQFVLRLINVLLQAEQKPAASDAINLISNLCVTLAIFFLPNIDSRKFLFLVLTFSIIPVIITLLSTIILFKGRYKRYKPSLKCVNFNYSKDLIGLGFKFFLLQICGLVMFSLTNFLISHFLDPSEVTVYNVAYRYISVGIMAFTIVLSPYWNAFTDAYIKGELDWIKNIYTKLFRIWMLFSFGIILMVLISPLIYKVWLSGQVNVPFQLTLFIGLFAIINNLTGMYVTLINGTGKIQVQTIYALISMTITIPISFFLVKTCHFGVSGFGLSLFVMSISGAIITRIQYKKIVNKLDYGIWSK